jgi:hypothetical protein
VESSARSSEASAPTIICVDCPAGAKRPERGSAFASSMRARSRPMERRIEGRSFSGASAFSAASCGSSTLMDSRSASLPASVRSSGAASGIVLR